MKEVNIILAHQRRMKFALLFIVLFAWSSFLHNSSWEGNTQLHVIMEVIATLLALIIGIIALVRYYSKRSNIFLFVGAGFLGTAFLDCYHFLITSPFFGQWLPSVPSSLLSWSWISSRIFLSILLFVSCWGGRKKEKGETGHIREEVVFIGMGVFTLVSFYFFAFFPLPPAYYPQFIFERPVEFIPALFFFLALVGYYRKGRWNTDPFEYWLVLSLIVGFMSHLMFMLFSSKIYDAMFDAADSLKIVSYICTLVGLVISMFYLFKQTEDQKKDLECINRELDRFVYSVSHDLRAPLRGIASFSTFLEEDYKDKLGEEGKDYLNEIRKGTNRLSMFIDDLLALSRISRIRNPYEDVRISYLIDAVLKRIEFSIKEANAELIIQENMPIVTCDRVKLGQVFLNLINNSIKFVAKNSNKNPRIEIGCAGTNEYYEFYVKDNGIGIDPRYHQQIFDAFRRLHASHEYEGTGVGLSIVKRIIEDHGGKIWVESALGEGTTFYFSIPKALQRKKKIGEILVEDGIISKEKLREKLEKQQEYNRKSLQT